MPMPEHWTHQYAVINGLRFHYVEAGSGPLVVLLHGFPEFWYSWKKQIPALSEAGFRVLAPDLRGYNESDKPEGVANYRVDLLVQDVVGLIQHAGEQQAVVVGHDWGGGVAWAVAMRRPEVVRRLVILNAPHPAAYRREVRKPAQMLRSWYILFFQLPWLPEWLLRLGNQALLARAFRRQPVHPDAFTPEDIEQYKKALNQPGALTAALNYYRALGRHRRASFRGVRTISAPTLLIWGERDPYLGIRLTEGLERWVHDLRIERLPDASHWVQNDAPERVNQLLVQFLRGTE
jgi:pimeloyl-ACP methyl ester carboxylesterase